MDSTLEHPKHQLIFQELRREILSGVFQSGDRFPSEAELVKRFGASRITVGRAVRDLSAEGFVSRRAGSGTYVEGRAVHSPESGFSFGLIIPDLGRTEIFEPICQGMADSPLAEQHSLIWSSAMRDEGGSLQEHAMKLCQQHIARKVAGVFFAPLERLDDDDRTNHRIMEALEKARIPVVLLDRDFVPYPQRSRHDLVGIDNRRTGFTATHHLLSLGCKRVVFLSFPRTPSTVAERIAGFREAHHVHERQIVPGMVQSLASDDEAEIARLMRSVNPDGFVCANDRTAGRLMQVLQALRKRIPRDVRIVGIDDVTYASLLPVPLTTMHQPCRDIGMTAMSAMIERIARPQMPVRDILLECPLVIRKSCGATLPAATGQTHVSKPAKTSTSRP